jgi:hypothetical protein
MTALTPALADPGPLQWMAAGLQARLQAAFSPDFFTFGFMPARADRAWFKRHFMRLPGVALGWNGSKGVRDDGMPWTAEASWTVALITKNDGSPINRYVGDALAPGLFAMQRVATIILHGYLIEVESTGWTSSGTVIVNAAGNLYNEEWGDEQIAICALDLSIRYEETQPPGLEPNLPNGSLADLITWDFGELAPLLTQTVQTGT